MFWKADKCEHMHQQCWLRHWQQSNMEKVERMSMGRRKSFPSQTIFNIILSCSLDWFPLPIPSTCLQTAFPFSGGSPSALPGPTARCGECSWAYFSSPRSILLPPLSYGCHSPWWQAGQQTGLWSTELPIEKAFSFFTVSLWHITLRQMAGSKWIRAKGWSGESYLL